jgi:uncharacterized membrane protein
MKGVASMPREERSIVINRPVDEVFAYVVDPRNNTMWNSWIVECHVTSDGPVGVGTTCRSVGKFLGKTVEADAVITECVPNERGSIRTTSGPITLTGSRIVEPANGGTRFTQTLEIDFKGLFGRLAEPLVTRAGIRQLEADLETLKDLLESGQAADATG